MNEKTSMLNIKVLSKEKGFTEKLWCPLSFLRHFFLLHLLSPSSYTEKNQALKKKKKKTSPDKLDMNPVLPVNPP